MKQALRTSSAALKKIGNANICNTSLRVICAVYMLSYYIKRSPNYQCLALRAFQLMEAGTRGGGCCGDEYVSLCVFESEASFHYVNYRLLATVASLTFRIFLFVMGPCMDKISIKTPNPKCRLTGNL